MDIKHTVEASYYSGISRERVWHPLGQSNGAAISLDTKVGVQKKNYQQVYRKVQAVALDILAKSSVGNEEYGENWQEENNA